MSKLCQNCGMRPATINATMTIGGLPKEISLCNSCAQKLGVSVVQNEGDVYEQILFASPSTEKCCPKCGTKESEFLQNGYCGCAVCYYTFSDIAKTCEKWHGKSKHVGKISKNNVLSRTRLETLMLRLKTATEQGNLPEINRLKREIKLLGEYHAENK